MIICIMSNCGKLINSELYDNILSYEETKEAENNFCGFLSLLNEIAQDNPRLINESINKKEVNFDLYEDNRS